MADNPFLRSLFVQPPEVLGRRLRPFSAYHAAALMLLDSPFMRGGKQDITPDDLVLAVFVCSCGFRDGPSKLFPAPAVEELASWGHQFDFNAGLATFRQYLDDYLYLPSVWQPEGEGKESGVPAPFHAVATVLQHMNGLSEAEAWDLPFARLVGYKAAIAEAHGWEVVSERQEALLREVERLNAAASQASQSTVDVKEEAQDKNKND